MVFTSVPLDRYTYEVIASEDPAEIGDAYTVNLPRDVIMMIAERDYYNASVQPDALRIGEEVFSHVPGRISSYPNESAKNATLLAGAVALGRCAPHPRNHCEPIQADPSPGRARSGAVSVGQAPVRPSSGWNTSRRSARGTH